MNCRVGRVLRRLDGFEYLKTGDLILHKGIWIKYYEDTPFGHTLPFSYYTYRPLTPEEVEDYKRRMNRCPVCGWDMDKLKHCTNCRMKKGMEHFDKIKNEVINQWEEL